MIIAQNNRYYTTTGAIFSDLESVQSYLSSNPVQYFSINLKSLEFSFLDGLCHLKIGEQRFPFSETGFKSLCKILKIPASYLNTLVSESLVLENLNTSPMKIDQEVLVYIRVSDDKTKYISAVSLDELFTYDHFLALLERCKFMENHALIFETTTLSNEELVFYALGKETVSFDTFSIQNGVALIVSEGLDTGFAIHEFSRISFQDDSFDFLGKSLKKISRKEKSYQLAIEDELRQWTGALQHEVYSELHKIVSATIQGTEINFGLLKQIASGIKRTYAFQAGIFDTVNVLIDIMPEFEAIKKDLKEEISELPKFEMNARRIDYFLPKLFSIYENHMLNMETPQFFNRQRRFVYKCLEKYAEQSLYMMN
jgi:hypothetical protein